MLHNEKGKINPKFIALFLLLATLIIVGLLNGGDKGVGVGKEYEDPLGPAVIVNSQELFKELDSEHQFNSIRNDLTYFANKHIDKYKNGDTEINFIISDLNKKDDFIFIEGKYSKSKNKILLKIKELNFGKVSITIEDSKSRTKETSNLPSNSIRNQYIGSLPYKSSDGYTISYTESDDSFYISINEGYDTAMISKVALSQIISQLDVDSLDNEKYKIAYWDSSGIPKIIKYNH